MTDLDQETINRALAAVGEILHAEGKRVAIVVTGGATLSLLGIVDRTTTDVDVIARARKGDDGKFELQPPEPLPAPLQRAVRKVARDLGLDDEWMNAAIGEQWLLGLPPQLPDDIQWTNRGGGLDVGLVGRRTLISLKLFAAVDPDVSGVHFQDLLALEPTDSELEEARSWVKTQDAADGWPEEVDRVVANAKRNR